MTIRNPAIPTKWWVNKLNAREEEISHLYLCIDQLKAALIVTKPSVYIMRNVIYSTNWRGTKYYTWSLWIGELQILKAVAHSHALRRGSFIAKTNGLRLIKGAFK